MFQNALQGIVYKFHCRQKKEISYKGWWGLGIYFMFLQIYRFTIIFSEKKEEREFIKGAIKKLGVHLQISLSLEEGNQLQRAIGVRNLFNVFLQMTCLYKVLGPMVRHDVLLYGFHTLPNLLKNLSKRAMCLFFVDKCLSLVTFTTETRDYRIILLTSQSL